MSKTTTLELQELFPDVEMLFLDGHDNAILGIDQNNYRVAYSLAKMSPVRILIEAL